MKTPLVGPLMAAVCVALMLVTTLPAQRAAAPGPQTGVAVLDMNVIAQKSVRFKQQLDGLKAELDNAATGFKKESESANQLAEQVRKLPPDSPDRKQRETQLMKMRADFELRGKRFNEDMHDRESKLIYAMTRELRDELARYAQSNGIQLVLRHDAAPLEELPSPQAILQEIKRPIVYQREGDITPVILEAMNRRGPATNAATRPAAPGKTQR